MVEFLWSPWRGEQTDEPGVDEWSRQFYLAGTPKRSAVALDVGAIRALLWNAGVQGLKATSEPPTSRRGGGCPQALAKPRSEDGGRNRRVVPSRAVGGYDLM
jgi:hypothetical protein